MRFAAKRLLLTSLAVALLILPAWGAPAPTTKPATAPAKSVKPGNAASAGMTRREAKELKWKKKAETGLRREEQVQQHIADLQKKGQPPPATRPVVANPQQYAEDFDWNVNWEQKDKRGVHASVDFGYASSNHLASVGCAPGEIGGSIASSGISWFADNVGRGPALLDVNIPLSASGWCTFSATRGTVNVGWFNAANYAA